MKKTLTHPLLEAHAVDGEVQSGGEIGLRIDQTLTQDATATLVYLAFEALETQRIQAEQAVSYVDHNIIQTDSRNADDHRFLESAAAKYGAVFSPPGNGVSHHVHRQRFGKPGKTFLGSDSHTTTGRCLGMLAMGAGGVEVALAMGGNSYHLAVPRVWGVHVQGHLRPYVSGKDVILSPRHLLLQSRGGEDNGALRSWVRGVRHGRPRDNRQYGRGHGADRGGVSFG